METDIRINEKLNLYCKIDSATGKGRGVVILIHGLGEHILRYDDWATRFVSEGYSIIRADLPGHGQSDGKRGHVSSFSLFPEIIRILIEKANEQFPGLPVILYGHSLGGAIVLDFLVSGAQGVSLSVVTSPWIKLSFEPPKSKMVLASAVKSILPTLIQSTGLVADHLSHDKEEVRKYISDPLVHSKISVALFTGVYNAGRNILRLGSRIDVPLLLIHGTDDRITSPSASAELAAKSGMIELRLWDGGYHELHNESFRDELFSEIVEWLNKNTGE